MQKAACYIDGFNFYRAVKDNPSANIDFGSLAASLIRPDVKLSKVYYFSAYATWRNDDYLKHRAYDKKAPKIGGRSGTFPFQEKARQMLCLQ